MEKKSILREIVEFLEYLAKADENARKEENLKKRFGEERYKAIYDLIGGDILEHYPKEKRQKNSYSIY